MLFNSFTFAVFLPTVVVVHFLLPHRFRWIWQLVASYTFYMWWRVDYALLLVGSTVLDWFVARKLHALPDSLKRTAWFATSIGTQLTLLFTFKYYNLFHGLGTRVAEAIGTDNPLPLSTLLLPVGISFYTFQTMSYVIDVWRRDLKAEPNLFKFALFVSFWPQLVAGPIERAGSLLPQLFTHNPFDVDRTISGLRLAAWGLFKKVVVADRLAPIADAIYSDPHHVSGFATVVGTLCFGWQIWLDFSGYSDIAVGTARIFGIELMRNFHQPHLATSVSDYWARWHVSLTTWFRDYLYFGLGGSRSGFTSKYRNILLVFTCSGLWHGANWSVALWGFFNGLWLVIDDWTRPARLRFYDAIGLSGWPRVHHVLSVVCTFGIMYLTYPFFRAANLRAWWGMMSHIHTGWSFDPQRLGMLFDRIDMAPALFFATILLIPVAEVGEYLHRSERVGAWTARQPAFVRGLRDLALVFGTLVLGRWSDAPFVYFQF